MAARRPVDWLNWKLYRRSWALCALAWLVVAGTSFRAEAPPAPALPPTFTNEQAGELLDRAAQLDKSYPDRRPGTTGSLDSAHWVHQQFEALGLRPMTVPNTSVSPQSDSPMSLVNVEALLPGRTPEVVVIYAHRDNAGKGGTHEHSVGTVTLLEVARQFSATRDRRRSYLFVSTDAGTAGSAGTRALAERLERRRVIAAVALDRVGLGSGPLRVPLTSSGRFAPPLGLYVAAQRSVAAEGGSSATPSAAKQLLQLALPITLYEHGQLVRNGIPAVALTSARERYEPTRELEATPQALGAGVRALQQLTSTLDGLDALQSAGKTYVLTDDRVYRGWALKIAIASMLFPFWITLVAYVARWRNRWNLAASTGSVTRAMIAGLWALMSLWALGILGVLPRSTEYAPHPQTMLDAPALGLLLWTVLAAAGWVLARGPDWRHALASETTSHDLNRGVLVVSLLVLGVLSALALAVNPFAVLFALPALHAWLCLCSRHAYGWRRVSAIWSAGLLGPLVAYALTSARLDLGAGGPWYFLQLVLSRTLPAAQSMLLFCGAAVAILVLVASLHRVGAPSIIRIRRTVHMAMQQRQPRLSLPSSGSQTQATSHNSRPAGAVRKPLRTR